MSLARLISRGQSGLDAFEVSVEVHLAGGLPAFTITGLPAPAVRESRDRVRAALQTSGIEIPPSRITAHLGPADIPKQGGRFDLPIALGIVAARMRKRWALANTEFLGELSLGGELRPVTGIVPSTLAARAAGRELVVPEASAAEAALVPGATVSAASHLTDVIAALDGKQDLRRVEHCDMQELPLPSLPLDDVRGHASAKRALAIAAAGTHNLLMIGPPGSGKTMLASRMPGLLPPLSEDELLEVASIASVAGIGTTLGNGRRRPFRSPHHTTRAPALVGGGAHPRPGEISLAHHGVLFLDELPEFSREALESLREPLETGRVSISRLGRRIDFPARFQLVAAMNPCPCGYYGDGTDRCRCAPGKIESYRARISGPLLDRFDLHIQVPPVAADELIRDRQGKPDEKVLHWIARALSRKVHRGDSNASRDERDRLAAAELDAPSRRLLSDAQRRWQLSPRGLVRVIRVATTIADLKDEPAVDQACVSEALHLRCLDRRHSGDTV